MIYFLDTNICIHIISGASERILNKIQKIGIDSVALPSVVAAELLYGAYKSVKREHNLAKIYQFIRQFTIVGFDSATIQAYGEIRAELERKGTPIGSNDYFIAAIAKGHNAILVTNNTREFNRVSNLTIEDWTQ